MNWRRIPGTWQSEDGRFVVKLRAAAVKRLLDDSAAAGDHETGGILVGRYGEGGRLAVVTAASSAPADSVHYESGFVRGTTGLQEWLDRVWKKGIYYLGEWHYHPALGASTPSSQDAQQMIAISRDESYSCPEPLLIVVSASVGGEVAASASIFLRDCQVPTYCIAARGSDGR